MVHFSKSDGALVAFPNNIISDSFTTVTSRVCHPPEMDYTKHTGWPLPVIDGAISPLEMALYMGNRRCNTYNKQMEL